MADDTLEPFGKFDLRSLGLLDGEADPAFERAVSLAIRLTHAKAATLSMVDYDSAEVRIRAAAGFDPASIVPTLPLERSLMGRMTSPRETLAVSHATRDPRTKDHPVVRHIRAESLLAAPIRCPVDDLVAILTVYDPNVRIWSVDERDALGALADYCTQTILLRAALETVRIVSRGSSRTAMR